MKLLAVDGNSIMNRAYYGIRPLTTKDGQFTHAIYGFLTMLLKIKADTNPDAVAIAFDLHAPTFRHKAYSGYKATRKGMPEELRCQVEPLKELLKLLGYKLVSTEGYEADDILGTFAKNSLLKNYECVIATGDRDSFQLISDSVSVRFAATKQGTPSAEIYDKQRIMDEYGVEPRQLIDIKAIQGDTSDNIPGVAGIGPKGATDLIKRFENLDNIYENIDTLDIKEGVRNKLKADKENAYLSRMLGEIFCDVPINTDIENYKVELEDKDAAARYMASLELFKLIEKVGLQDADTTAIPEKESVKTKVVENYTKAPIECVIDAEFEDGKVKKIIAVTEGKVYVSTNEDDLNNLLSDKKLNKVVYDSKPLFSYADKKGIDVQNIVFDVSLAAYLLSPSSTDYSIERLCTEYSVVLPELIGEGVSKEQAAHWEVYLKLKKQIEEKEQLKLLCDIEIPLANVLARMENLGFAVDAKGIEDYAVVISEKLKNMEQEIYKEVGYEFNINSPKQLGEALFVKLEIPTGKKTKSGYSTSADVLDSLKDSYPVVKHVLEYRTYAKLKSTYCDGLLKVIAPDGRIHSSFNQKETRTGRISSTEPNLQNIPVRTELGRELRKFFKGAEGCVLVDADYSQIELRVLADIANDREMIKAFTDNVDIHTVTASQVFALPLDMVSPIHRSRAKAVNFGIVYGIGAYSLAKDIGVSNKEAKAYIDNYLKHYSGIDSYMKNVIERAKNEGFVETVFGRRRYLPELTASNHMTRAFGERVARNMPIQGTAADIIKIAMIKVDKRLKADGLSARLILQVHDELIVECPEYEAMQVAMILQEEMESAVKLSVPLVAEASVGKTWYDAKG
ncbi:MAG: DNA polymerase I [Clostridia bacterium]|nr:DNA polymerase I [Clostridia bacterium]